jgi:DNA gyrase subunit A
MLITREGVVLRTSLNQIRETGRSTQGVKLMNLYEGDEVVGIAIFSDQNDTNGTVGEASEDGTSVNEETGA